MAMRYEVVRLLATAHAAIGILIWALALGAFGHKPLAKQASACRGRFGDSLGVLRKHTDAIFGPFASSLRSDR